jgi:hypothetical protein
LYVEDLSRRDAVKVAQYEVLGNDEKDTFVPGDDRNAWLLVSRADQRLPSLVDRPVPPSSRRRFAGAAFCLRARHSSKSEGGILTTADRPGRIAL